MWIVVYKQYYYPCVFECKSESEADDLFERLKKKEFDYENAIEEGRLYKAKVEKIFGGLEQNIIW